MTVHDPPTDLPELQESVEVDGAYVRFSVSGRGEQDVALVHGSGAHHGWWYRVVPALKDHWRVITLDLSGHGDSDHRERYDAATWGRDLLGVLDAAGSTRPLVVGHSLGGRVGLLTAATHPQCMSGLVLVDAALRPPPAFLARENTRKPPVQRRYPTREDAMARFRLMPPQRQPADNVLATLAAYSVRETAEGWTWKHDHRGFPPLYDAEVAEAARTLRVPLGYVYGGDSGLVDDDAAALIGTLAPTEVPTIRVPGATHHVPVDAPLECARAIDEIATRWRSAGARM
ncbi:alpha/beta fold hydrolase [Pseudonocardia kunmingensis]|uniref:Pimeloyl-ACP methyl ester carboxylesterase n=1 Tax=Pseudonocardia kunmingensis TaxID=630975 RepID=A0A543DPE3_9PSEU|nr:alpha/beta hydrolase [Pseudonocardia kunmingensis]TQM11200.1 pimeloyl-ACP methyl ester carboxylesterase [Pseudonocardia kunmingensis]